MKVIAFMVDVSPARDTGEADFTVNYMTSDGQLSGSMVCTVTISDSESAITADIKQQVANEVNRQLRTSITKHAVRLF